MTIVAVITITINTHKYGLTRGRLEEDWEKESLSDGVLPLRQGQFSDACDRLFSPNRVIRANGTARGWAIE